MRKALRWRAFEAVLSVPREVAADESGQSLLDYALIAGSLAAMGVTMMALIARGTLTDLLGRMAGALSG